MNPVTKVAEFKAHGLRAVVLRIGSLFNVALYDADADMEVGFRAGFKVESAAIAYAQAFIQGGAA